MNAKVNISEQLVPFYTTADVLKAYTLASETSTHLRTLANQIIKNTAFVKAYAEENNADISLFTELENLNEITRQLAHSQVDTYNLELKRHKQESIEQYFTGDLLDAYSLAAENTTWLVTMFYQIKDEAEIVKEALKHHMHSSVFASLDNLIGIATYISDNHSNMFDIEREKHEIEWEASKNV